MGQAFLKSKIPQQFQGKGAGRDVNRTNENHKSEKSDTEESNSEGSTTGSTNSEIPYWKFTAAIPLQD